MKTVHGMKGYRLLPVYFLIVLAVAAMSGVSSYAVDDPNTPVSNDESYIDGGAADALINPDAGVSGEASGRATQFEGGGEDAFAGLDELTKEVLEAEGVETAPLSPEELAEIEALEQIEPVANQVGAETILGVDTRLQVNPTTYPARATALITSSGGRCTGWLYGRDIVATAGHCVHSGGAGGNWYTNVRVYPGYNFPNAPYGSCTARRLHSVTGWTTSGDERFDYGAVKLNCSVGNAVGWFGHWWQTASLNGNNTIINGYPGDKQLTQWVSGDQVRSTDTYQIYYSNDTIGGVSGSPVWQDRPTGSSFCVGACVGGIHAYALHGSPPHRTYNHGTRLRQPVVANLVTWRNAP